jgi:hypothetical protein
VAMIEIKTEPSVRELRVFAVLWLVFWVVLGLIATTRPDALAVPAALTGGCLLASLAWNREVSGLGRLWGLGFPLGLASLWVLGRLVMPDGGSDVISPRTLLGGTVVVGMAGLVMVLVSRRRGLALYRAWMLAAMPIGWVLSNVMLMAVFYGVVTAVGLVMRVVGRDPLTRTLDRGAASYWAEHRRVRDPKRYFRQS